MSVTSQARLSGLLPAQDALQVLLTTLLSFLHVDTCHMLHVVIGALLCLEVRLDNTLRGAATARAARRRRDEAASEATAGGGTLWRTLGPA